MGFGPAVIELYRQLKTLGVFEGIDNVMELGSQDYICPNEALMSTLLSAFCRPVAGASSLSGAQKPARLLYEALGITYRCVDVDGRPETLNLDINFDELPATHRAAYSLVTNFGTSEHVFNQANIFRMMHDLARPAGLMIHAVPFMGYVDHGFFSYHPNFFECLARYNDYELLGMWIGPGSDGRLHFYVPWHKEILSFLTLKPDSAHILIVAFRKRHDCEFCVPFQEQYESFVPADTLSRYSAVINGQVTRLVQLPTFKSQEIETRDARIAELLRAIDTYAGRVQKLEQDAGAREAAGGGTAAPNALQQVSGKRLIAELVHRVARRIGTRSRYSKTDGV